MTADEAMARAVALAEHGAGQTAPNPMVGCVIVQGAEVVGEGWHRGPGLPHAEREALAAAGARARGATLYSTLEPCCHVGRTPPCTEAIIAAGVARVVCGVLDPDPRVAGRGIAQLRAAGLEVEFDVGRASVQHHLRAYLHQRRTGRPWIIAKWAMTLDGKLASASGDSRWVSGPEAREYVHRLRAHADAILVGAGTAVADDPNLTVRLPNAPGRRRPPWRVVVDTHGRTPATSRLFCDGAAPTLWAVGSDPTIADRPPAETLRLPERAGRVDLEALATALGGRGLIEVLCEAGGQLTGALLDAGLVNEVVAVVAPKLVGGCGASPWEGPGRATMAEALVLTETVIETVGADVVLRGLVEGS